MPDQKTPPKLITVTGTLDVVDAGITDAHNHIWIAPVFGAQKGAPVLDDQTAIEEELIDFRQAGGGTIIDCQPGGCGRDGNVLRDLAKASGVNITASTGFHLKRYYPPGYWLFREEAEKASEYFIQELQEGIEETREGSETVRAGLIKIACEESLVKSPLHLIEAAVAASVETGAGIEVHTERGADAERIAQTMFDFGLTPQKLVLCHVDKLPDFGFHSNMAQEGILLEYDTFYRQKYRPDQNVWSLLERMVGAGYESQVAIATDMAEAEMWSRMGDGPGLTGLITKIIPSMVVIGFEPETIRKLTGENIAQALARPDT
jgi:phosphotriesterase-related protein